MTSASTHPLNRGSVSLLLALLLLPVALCAAPGDLIWNEQTGGIIYGAPAIGPYGEIVTGSEDGNLYSFNPDSSLRWVFTGATDWLDSSPTIASDGTVYAGSWDGYLYAVDGEDGSLDWKFQTGGFIVGSPAIGQDGTIYVPSNDGLLYAISASGSLKWVSDFLNSLSPVNSSPVLNASGDTVYFGNDSGALYALSTSDGAERWAFAAATVHPPAADDSVVISGSIAIADDGGVYFGCENTYLYALSADGTLRWHYRAAEPIRSSPVVSEDGVIYFTSQDGYLYALDSEGFQLWETYIGDVFHSSPAIDALGNIIVAGYAGSASMGAATRVASVSSAGSVNWEFLISDYNDSSPNIAPDGSIYIGAHDGVLYKLEGAAPLMQGQWPRVQGNRRQTGYPPDLARLELIDYFPEITLSADGWAFVPWLGSGWINNRGLPWIQHIDHGYLYMNAPSGGGQWYFDLGLKGWIYAPVNAPNYFYQFNTSSWLFHLPGSSVERARWFYDFGTGLWVSDVSP